MRQFYYFSKNKLKFVEIRNFYIKFLFLTVFFSLVASFFVFSSYFIVREVLYPGAEVQALENENEELTRKFAELLNQYKVVNKKLDNLAETDNQIRLAVNLTPVPPEDRITGLGGSVFNDMPLTTSKELRLILDEINSYANDVEAKLAYEKSNYSEIQEQLDVNTKLYDAIPALKPINATYGDRFGMRNHPILKVRKMHNGIDLVADVGTKVYAPGAGKVIFAGYKSSTGHTIEIDHGFGYKTSYYHLSKLNVKKGNKVQRGDQIGISGRTGRLCSGPHLHYEVHHNGVALNPRNFIFDDINIFEYSEIKFKEENL